MTVSIGIAVAASRWPDGSEQLVKAADAGLHEAKRLGRNQVCWVATE